jgi:putative inorganic carbon (HCO3(-)) transporter
VTALLARADLETTRWGAAALAICMAIGIVAGVKPAYGIAGALAVSFMVGVFANLTAGVALFTTLSFLDVLQFGGGALTFMKLAGLLLFLSWFARASSAPRNTTRALMAEQPALVVAVIVFLSWTALSLAWATSRSSATTQTYSLVLDSLLIPIVFAAVNDRRDALIIVVAFIIGAVGSGAYGIIHPVAVTAQDAGRLAGGLGDANIQATVMVAAIALCIPVIGAARRSPMLMFATIVAGVISFVSLVETESRGGLLSFGCVLLAALFVSGRWKKYAIALVVVGVAAVGVYFVAIASQSAVSRVTSSNSSGRSDLWTVAWRVFEAHPLLGAGANNFDVVSVHYLDRPGVITAATYIVDTPKVVHNIYLEQLADLGVPGLLTLLAVLGYTFSAGWTAAKRFERLGDRQLELLSRCTLLALIGFVSSYFFLSDITSKQLWIVMALCPALLKLAKMAERESLRTA